MPLTREENLSSVETDAIEALRLSPLPKVTGPAISWWYFDSKAVDSKVYMLPFMLVTLRVGLRGLVRCYLPLALFLSKHE